MIAPRRPCIRPWWPLRLVGAFLLATGTVLLGSVAPGRAAPDASGPAGLRTVVNLDGEWDLAATPREEEPRDFAARAPVPGLVDLAVPHVPSDAGAYWYRRKFRVPGPARPVCRLKVSKAMYGTRVLLNGVDLGSHGACFTPGWFDASAAVRFGGAENEVLVRVGRKEHLPVGALGGDDLERSAYIPGVYDSVELHTSGEPHVAWVQVAPLPDTGAARVLALLRSSQPAADVAVRLEVLERGRARPVGVAQRSLRVEPGKDAVLDAEVAVPQARLWSPEDPFLYELLVTTPGDQARAVFGMRTFRFDPATRKALLNGRPYPLRGTNFTFHRFIEDAERGTLLWDEAWARKVVRGVKAMNGNAARFSIGFPPELWYRVADEEGLVVQDEFPIWGLKGLPKETTVEALATEYAEWMVERWNHPCVCIWDASNEAPYTPATGWAVRAVRGYDLSARPWENGGSEIPDDPLQVWECHPYLFLSAEPKDLDRLNGALEAEATVIPGLPVPLEPYARGKPKLVNEYGMLWLNRDGSPTSYTKPVYERLLGLPRRRPSGGTCEPSTPRPRPSSGVTTPSRAGRACCTSAGWVAPRLRGRGRRATPSCRGSRRRGSTRGSRSSSATRSRPWA